MAILHMSDTAKEAFQKESKQITQLKAQVNILQKEAQQAVQLAGSAPTPEEERLARLLAAEEDRNEDLIARLEEALLQSTTQMGGAAGSLADAQARRAQAEEAARAANAENGELRAALEAAQSDLERSRSSAMGREERRGAVEGKLAGAERELLSSREELAALRGELKKATGKGHELGFQLQDAERKSEEYRARLKQERKASGVALAKIAQQAAAVAAGPRVA